MSDVSAVQAGILPPLPISSPVSGGQTVHAGRTTDISAILGPLGENQGDYRTMAFRAALEQAGLTKDATVNADTADASSGKGDVETYSKFEAMVISQLVSTMLSTGGDGMFGEEGGMQAFSSIFAGAIGDAVVKHGGIGLAETIVESKPGVSASSDLQG